MRRFIALILMLIIPLQFAWSAAAGVHGHLGDNVSALGFHAHDNHDGEHPDHDATGDMDKGHNEDGHHGSHYHPVFSSMLMESGLGLNLPLPDGPPPHQLVVFFSRTPPPLDRPPLALA
ncbi:MAG: hypothetical protein HY778_09845 [Betaproteobacteria bacterium]|nr:hypothetical protein [Betaproteobacteria bacterium]